jgi:hypothetical protein
MSSKKKAAPKKEDKIIVEPGPVEEAAPVRPEKRIAIVGCSDSKDTAPYGDKSWEIWSMNNTFNYTKRQDMWFEVHPIILVGDQYKRRKLIGPGVFEWSDDFRGQPMKEYMLALAHLNCPVYMQQHWDIIPKSLPYPIDDITHRFGRYFTNSVSYIIAMAIVSGATEIGCFGIDMAAGCPAPDVKILTSDLRWVPAGQLNIGDEVMAFDENSHSDDGPSRRWRTATVTSCPKITKPCYRLKLEDGTEMIVSARHGWLTHSENVNKWRAQENLITPHHREDRPTRIVRALDTWEPDDSWEAGYLAAAFDGEGHISQTPRHHNFTCGLVAGFAQKENKMSETVENIMRKYGFECRMNKEDGGTRKYRINGGRPEILRFLGSVRPPRLLNKFNGGLLGQFNAMQNVAVIESEFIGDHEVIGLETTEKTFIAEGLASHNSEYGPQRPSCEWMLGIAAGLGIRLNIPPQADLLKTSFLYGFEEREQTLWESKLMQMKNSMMARRQKQEAIAAAAERTIQQYHGAEEAVNQCMRVWSNLMTERVWKDKLLQ